MEIAFNGTVRLNAPASQFINFKLFWDLPWNNRLSYDSKLVHIAECLFLTLLIQNKLIASFITSGTDRKTKYGQTLQQVEKKTLLYSYYNTTAKLIHSSKTSNEFE